MGAGGTTGDTKDWTWVLRRPCPECGFEAAAVALPDLPARFRENAARWQDVLAGDVTELRRHPADGVWSPLGYAGHVADVYRLMLGRASAMLADDDPTFGDWNQDVAAVEGRYDEADPAAVAAGIAAAADALAEVYAGLDDAARQRTGRRSDGAGFTVASLGRYALHDIHHHLHDVTGP